MLKAIRDKRHTTSSAGKHHPKNLQHSNILSFLFAIFLLFARIFLSSRELQIWASGTRLCFRLFLDQLLLVPVNR